MNDQQNDTQELNRKAWVAPAVIDASTDLVTEAAAAGASDGAGSS